LRRIGKKSIGAHRARPEPTLNRVSINQARVSSGNGEQAWL
jgi:hypothetical protein